jgi:hypothetical protein
MPECRVKAFETDFLARRQIRRLARLNQVEDRIEVLGKCQAKTLREHLRPGTLLVCDIEGGELILLDPAAVPALRQAQILAEVHDGTQTYGSTANGMRERFARSHEIIELRAKERSCWMNEHRTALPLSTALLTEAVEEHRSHGMTWLWMRPKLSAGTLAEESRFLRW